MIVAAAYAISYFYDKFGSFTVRIDKYDMVKQGLTLSETPNYDISKSVLNADIVYNMTNISGEDIPPTVDQVNGTHNGENYIAWFNKYTGEITACRNHMIDLQKKLDSLK